MSCKEFFSHHIQLIPATGPAFPDVFAAVCKALDLGRDMGWETWGHRWKVMDRFVFDFFLLLQLKLGF
jgi:hypothetical protein